LLHGHTQMIDDCQLWLPTLGPSALPDYGSMPHPGITQLANLLLSAFERRFLKQAITLGPHLQQVI
jgi:hypothetical protein